MVTLKVSEGEAHMRGKIAAIVLVVIGSIFLLSNLGLLSLSVRELFRTWWPLILIAVGVSLFFRHDRKK
jgi:hypothetical protein